MRSSRGKARPPSSPALARCGGCALPLPGPALNAGPLRARAEIWRGCRSRRGLQDLSKLLLKQRKQELKEQRLAKERARDGIDEDDGLEDMEFDDEVGGASNASSGSVAPVGSSGRGGGAAAASKASGRGGAAAAGAASRKIKREADIAEPAAKRVWAGTGGNGRERAGMGGSGRERAGTGGNGRERAGMGANGLERVRTSGYNAVLCRVPN